MKKYNRIALLFIYALCVCVVGNAYRYVYATVYANPYQGILLTIALFLIAYMSLVPAALLYFALVQKKYREFSLVFFGSITGLLMIYAVEFFSSRHPVMWLYVQLHDYLFDRYTINIFYLDYGGFGVLLAGISAATFSLLPFLVYRMRLSQQKK